MDVVTTRLISRRQDPPPEAKSAQESRPIDGSGSGDARSAAALSVSSAESDRSATEDPGSSCHNLWKSVLQMVREDGVQVLFAGPLWYHLLYCLFCGCLII